MVTLTSFKKSVQYEGEKFSVARFQPRGFRYAALKFLAAEGADGQKLLFNQFKDPIPGYAEALREGYRKRWGDIEAWLKSLSPEKDIVLCCWCPYSKVAQNEIRRFGGFACHTGLIGQMIVKHRPDIAVSLDEDRQLYLIPAWR